MEFIFDYLKHYGNKTFKEKAFNEVDALILCQFSYMKWDGIIPGLTENKSSIGMKHIKNKLDEAKVFSDPWFGRKNRSLFYDMEKSKRFGSMRCNYFAGIVNEDMNTQFCAFVCFPEGTYPVVVFRGTDETLVGWKEDLLMLSSKPVWAQYLSVIYLNRISKLLSGKYIMCGHSKGGNLAIFAASQIKDVYVRKIRRIYSFDSPGFQRKLLKSYGYIRIKNRIRRYIPGASVVGMLLNEGRNCKIVKCKGVGVFQHNPYVWSVKEDHFVRLVSLRMKRHICYRAFNRWLMNVDEEELVYLADILFAMLQVNCDKTTYTWSQNWKNNVVCMLKTAKSMSKAEKKRIFRMLWRLILL